MNETHIENLRILGNFLIDYKGLLGFDMSLFVDRENSEVFSPTTIRLFNKNDCHTTACALGHAPLIRKPSFKPKEHESWAEYSERLFGMFESTYNSEGWFWCFGAGWKNVDNTCVGAGKRILWLCAHGLPQNWSEQLNGKAELCYE